MKRTLVICSLALLLGACSPFAASTPKPMPIPTGALVIDASFDLAHVGKEVPPDFLGLSFEASEMANPVFDSNETLMQLLRALGPGVLRFGGNSVDKTTWSRTASTKDARTMITPADLDRVFTFAQRIGWRVILGVNLGANDPTTAADEADYAVTHGGDTLLALEIGNEPDLYQGWHRQAPWDYAHFHADFDAYVQAIRARAPNAPLAGPATAGTKWLAQFMNDEGDKLALVTQHSYPLWKSADKPPDAPTYPSLDHMLDTKILHEAANTADLAAKAAQTHQLRARIAETNSVASGGEQGVSDVFGAALWGVNHLFTLAEHGASGANLHTGGRTNCVSYSPICITEAGVTVRPLYYGMLLFHAAAQGRIVPLQLTSDGDLNGYATQSDDGMRVALVNSNQTRAVAVRFGPDTGYTHATVERLSAPSITATNGITFGSSGVDSSGQWTPGPAEPAIRDRNTLEVALPAASAVVITLTR